MVKAIDMIIGAFKCSNISLYKAGTKKLPDGRGCVKSGRVFEFASQRWFVYFHSKIVSPKKKSVKIEFRRMMVPGENVTNLRLNSKPEIVKHEIRNKFK
jgi:hypothetical protein